MKNRKDLPSYDVQAATKKSNELSDPPQSSFNKGENNGDFRVLFINCNTMMDVLLPVGTLPDIGMPQRKRVLG